MCSYKSLQNLLRERALLCFAKPLGGPKHRLDDQSNETERKQNDSAYSTRKTGVSQFSLGD